MYSPDTPVSGKLEVRAPFSVRWKVNVPFDHEQKAVSTDFRFQQALWYLVSGEVDRVIWLGLYHRSGLPVERESLSGSIRVEGDKTGLVLSKVSEGSLHAFSKASELPKSCVCFWSASKWDVVLADPSFAINRGLTFQVTIEERELDILQTGTKGTQTVLESSDDSTQTDCILSSAITADIRTFPCLVSLSDDLAKLLTEQSNPDVEFQCAGLSTKAHKTVVSARSPVLESMLNSDMVEGRTGKVKIPDMDADTFKQFLQYLYSGKLDELTFDAAMHLYEAGDQYAVHGLTRQCSEFLIKNLSEENAYDVLSVADAHSDSKLVEVVVDYMVENKFPLSSNGWLKFCDIESKLAMKVMHQAIQKSK